MIPSPGPRSQSRECSSVDEEGASSSSFSSSRVGFLTPSTIDLILFGRTTVLKYWDKDKKTIVKKSSSGGHAEEQMLSYIYKKELITVTNEVHTEVEESQRYNILQLSKTQKRQEKVDKLYFDTLARSRKQELEKEEEELEKEEEHLKIKQTDIKKIFKKLADGKELTVSDRSLKNIEKDLRKHVPGEELKQRLKECLPAEFWVSKSPCQDCSKLLIKAYKGREKPTIYICNVYEGDPENLHQLKASEFKFEQWDLYIEYEEWKQWFEATDRYKNYQQQYESTCKKLWNLGFALPENV